MTSYRRVWMSVIGVAVLTGVAVSVLTLPIAVVAKTLAFGVVMGAAVGWAVQVDRRPGRWGRAAMTAGCSGGAVVALAGLTTFLGPAVYVVAMVAIGSSPQVLTRLRRYVSRRNGATPHSEPTESSSDQSAPTSRAGAPHLDLPPDIALLPTSPTLLEDETLCLAWRRSLLLLQQSSSVDTRMLVVQLRERYLDEMERRNPAGLSEWLTSGGPPASDPSGYLTTGKEPPSTDNGRG